MFFYIVIYFCLVCECFASPHFKEGNILLDDELQITLQNWTEKIAQAANLRNYQPKVYIVFSKSINAFATLCGKIVLNSELIKTCQNAEQLLSVLAHEIAHVAGGHVNQLDVAVEQALKPAVLATLLGGALALAIGSSTPLVAGFVGGVHLAERSFLQYSRAHETIADQVAVNILIKLGISPKGMIGFLNLLDRKLFFRADPYTLTHPLTSERIRLIQSAITNKSFASTIEPYQHQFLRIKAKLIGFTEDPQKVFKDYSNQDFSAQYSKSIAHYRVNQLQEALRLIDLLQNLEPKNPYLYELKGQMLFENGRLEEAVQSLKKAIDLEPKAYLIKLIYAHVLLESSSLREAINILHSITSHLQDNPLPWRLLATAYGNLNQMGQVQWCLAEEALILDKKDIAKQHLKKAQETNITDPKIKQRLLDMTHQLT